MVVEREGLLASVVSANVPITALIAPAGFGKSTLARMLVEKLDPSGAQTAYIDLWECESAVDLARCIADAFAATVPSTAGKIVQAETAVGGISDERWFATLRRLWTTLKEPHFVVFDSVDRLRSDEAALKLLRFMLRSRNGRQIVVCARPPNPIALSAVAAPSDIVTLRVDDLRFSEPEIDQLFEGTGISEAELRDIRFVSTGWPFAALLMRRIALHGRIDGILKGGAARMPELGDYLIREVVSQLQPDAIELLLNIVAIPGATRRLLAIALQVSEEAASERIRRLEEDVPLVSERSNKTLKLHPLLEQALDAHYGHRIEAIRRAAIDRCAAAGKLLTAAELCKLLGDSLGAAAMLSRAVTLIREQPPVRYYHLASDLPFSALTAHPLVWATMIRQRRCAVDAQTLVSEGDAIWRSGMKPQERLIVGPVYAILLGDAGRLDEAESVITTLRTESSADLTAPRAEHAAILTVWAWLEAMRYRFASARKIMTAVGPLIGDPHIKGAHVMHILQREAMCRGQWAEQRRLAQLVRRLVSESGTPISLAEALAFEMAACWIAGDDAVVERSRNQLREVLELCVSDGFEAFSTIFSRAETADLDRMGDPRMRAIAVLAVLPHLPLPEARTFVARATAAANEAHDEFLMILADLAQALLWPPEREKWLVRAKVSSSKIESRELNDDIDDLIDVREPRGPVGPMWKRFTSVFPPPVTRFNPISMRAFIDGAELHLSEASLSVVTLLALSPNGFMSSAALCEFLWPDLDDASARNRLKTYVARARQQLRNRDSIVAQYNGYAIKCAVEPTLADVRAAIERTRSDAPTAADIELLRSVMNLAALPLHETAALTDWYVGVREQLRLLSAESFEALILHHVTEGNIKYALTLAEQFRVVHPRDSYARESIIGLAYSLGDREKAMREYQLYLDMLADQPSVFKGRNFEDIVASIKRPKHSL